jgi:hypothetical protein
MSAQIRTRHSGNISITSAFDGGNIQVVHAADPNAVQLRIKPDPFCEKDGRQHFQWFHFQLSGRGR